MLSMKRCIQSLTSFCLAPLAITQAIAGTSGVAGSSSPPNAGVLLMEMASYLAAQPQLTVDIEAGFDVLQADGRKIQFLEGHRMLLKRPKRLRIDPVSTGGQSLLFDSDNITVLHRESGLYAQVPQPESIDDAILYFIRDLEMRLPLAPLMTTWFPQELSHHLLTVDYVESTFILGQLTHHLSARLKQSDMQVWIAAGDAPLPLRVVLTYPTIGNPQYWADFRGWDTNPELNEDDFSLQLPLGAKPIAFTVQFPQVTATYDSGVPQ